MTRRERLMATLRGEPVDRPAFCFYEINGHDESRSQDDALNIYSDPSWWPLLDLARDHSDRILMRTVDWVLDEPSPVSLLTSTESEWVDGSRLGTATTRAPGRTLTARSRQDPDVNTVWDTEHLLKGVDDLLAYLEVPAMNPSGKARIQPFLEAESAIGETGIVMIDTADPLCMAAGLFSMEDYTVIALTEPELFRELLERFAPVIQTKTEAVAAALPGRLWRIYGPEYASPPYLPPALFREYVCTYVKPMIDAIQKHGGFARVHCHGRISMILDDIAAMGPSGLDPIEPPPQGDVQLREVRQQYGREMVLFGNLESSDIENLPTPQFADKVRRALVEGTEGDGRGFVLMPSSCPYGRKLSSLTLRNYEAMTAIAMG